MANSGRKTKTGSETSIQGGVLYFNESAQCEVDAPIFADIIGDKYTNAIRLMSLDHNWIQNVWINYETRIKEAVNVEMSLRAEMRRGKKVWYAYRRVMGTLHKRYVGASEDITQEKLLQIAMKMPST